jgi:hypothetical protein
VAGDLSQISSSSGGRRLREPLGRFGKAQFPQFDVCQYLLGAGQRLAKFFGILFTLHAEQDVGHFHLCPVKIAGMLLEVTPENFRIRKRILNTEERGKQQKKTKELLEA